MTRKRRARMRREEAQRRWILIATGSVLAVVLGLLGFGFVKTRLIDPQRPAFTINGEAVTREQFRGRVRLNQIDLLNELRALNSAIGFYGSAEQLPERLQQNYAQTQTLLDNPEFLGQQVIEALTTEILVRQEAARRGIEVTQEELDREVARYFGFFTEGTPTQLPLPTSAPTQAATMPPEAEETAGPSPTTAPTFTPAPTPTEYTREAYVQNYAAAIEDLRGLDVPEFVFLNRIEATLYQRKLLEDFRQDIPREADHVWHEYIVVDGEQEAEDLLTRLEQGETWDDLVASFSDEGGQSANNVDLGWLTQDDLQRRFGEEYAAELFEAPIGEVGGPVETSIGWHIYLIKGHEVRERTDTEFDRLTQNAYREWLQGAQQAAQVELEDDWASAVPPVPARALQP
jgi:parvulin-like peptidyl-prolyl isomerase